LSQEPASGQKAPAKITFAHKITLDEKQQIEFAACLLAIPLLAHFTRACNLASILEHGLCSIDRAKELGIEPHKNDLLRLDGRFDAISLSIAFPNHRMFFKYREKDPSENWAVMLIESAVLWRKKCAFYQRNAADHRIRARPLSDLMSVNAFSSMFEEIDDVPSRQIQGLFDYDPTDSQAEVLVFEPIEPNLIAGVAFDSAQVARAHSRLRGDRHWEVFSQNKGPFSSRDFARKMRN
jgi:hypothetical protein